MSPLTWIIEPSFAVRLTMALLHFLWQGCCVGVLIVIATAAFKRASASWRYTCNVVALLLMAACLPVTFFLIEVPPQTTESVAITPVEPEPDPSGSRSNPTEEPMPAEVPLVSTDLQPQRDVSKLDSQLDPNLTAVLPPPTFSVAARPQVGAQSNRPSRPLEIIAPWISTLYLICVVSILARLLQGVSGGNRLRRLASVIDDARLLDLVGQQARRLGLRVVPAIAWCEQISIPVVVGIIKPMILLPMAVVSGLTSNQLQALLLHELAHIRRFDPIVNVLQRVVEAVLFFHPVVWFVSRRISIEREHAADDIVLAAGWDRPLYADALVRMAELSLKMLDPVVSNQAALISAAGTSPTEFKRRVLRLLDDSTPPKFRLTRGSVLAIILAVCSLFGTMVYVQAKSQTQSETTLNHEAAATGQPAAAESDASDVPSKFEKTDSNSTDRSGDKAAKVALIPHFLAELPGGLQVEFVGITKNTAPVKNGWRPDGTPLGDEVGDWKSTIVLHDKNSSSAYAEKGPHPTPDPDALDFLFRIRGLNAQPSIHFELPANGASYHNNPVQNPYELRVSARRRGVPPPGAKWSTPDDELQIALTDEPWGRYVRIRPEGTVFDPIQPDERYAATYQLVEVVGAKPLDQAPTGMAILLRSPTGQTDPENPLHRYTMEFRAVDTEGNVHWALEWSGRGVPQTRLEESLWGLAQPLPAGKTLSHYEYRLRPYQHWVTFKGISLEPGQKTHVKVNSETFDFPVSTVDSTAPGADLRKLNEKLKKVLPRNWQFSRVEGERSIEMFPGMYAPYEDRPHVILVFQDDNRRNPLKWERKDEEYEYLGVTPWGHAHLFISMEVAESMPGAAALNNLFRWPEAAEFVKAFLKGDQNQVVALKNRADDRDYARDHWGPIQNGIRGRWVNFSEQLILGKKVSVGLDFHNFGTEPQTIRIKQAHPWRSWEIIGPDGTPVEFNPGAEISSDEEYLLKPNSSITLFGGTDLTQLFDLSKPGDYILRFTGQRVREVPDNLDPNVPLDQSLPTAKDFVFTLAQPIPQPRADVKVEMITGTVVSMDLKPVPGIELVAFESEKQLDETFTTDERGEFHVPKAWRTTDHYLTLVARDGRERIGWFDFFFHAYSDNGQKSADGSFQVMLLPINRTIRGRLVANGKPLAQIPLHVDYLQHEINFAATHWKYQSIGDQPLIPGAITDDEGQFELKLPANSSGWLGSSHPDWVVPRIQVSQGKDEIPMIQVVPAAKVAGRVVDSRTGKPLAGIHISAQALKPRMASGLYGTAKTDVAGSYTIGGLAGGGFTIQLSKVPFKTLTAPSIAAIEFKSGKTYLADFRLIVGKRLTGRVIDSQSGQPVSNCTVNYSGSGANQSVETDVEGNFEIFVPPGKCNVDAGESRVYVNEQSLQFDVAADRDPDPVVLKVGPPEEAGPLNFKIFVGPPLERKVSVHFQRAPLVEVLEHCCMAAAVKLDLDINGLKSEGYTKNMPVTIDADGITLRDALNRVLKPYEKLSFWWDEPQNQVFVSSVQQVETREQAAARAEAATGGGPGGEAPLEAKPAWGQVTNGLRARVIPVLSSMSEDAIDPAKRVNTFAKPDDLAFVFELENVSEKPIQILDTRYGEGYGKSAGKANSDWSGQFLFSIDLFDLNGKKIERPEVQVVDLDMVLNGVQVVHLDAGKTHRFLLRPAKWGRPLAPRIEPGEYRAAVRYLGLPRRVATRIKEYRPASTVLGTVAGDIVSLQVPFEVLPPAPVESQSKGDDPQVARVRPKLVWGEVSNGLRAAMEFFPQQATYAHGQKPETRLLVQNVSEKSIVLSSHLWLSDLAATVKNEQGQPVTVNSTWYSGWTLTSRVTLLPRQIVEYQAGNIGLAISDERAKKFEHVTHRTLVVPSGQYTIQLEAQFGGGGQLKDGQGKVLAPLEGDWQGELKTGATPFTITEEITEKTSSVPPRNGSGIGTDIADWGAESNGLRCRLVAVPTTTNDDSPDTTKSMNKFARGADVAFAVELKNVSDKAQSLIGVRRSAPKQPAYDDRPNPEFFAPHLFDFEFTSDDGRPVPRTARAFIDIPGILNSTKVQEISPGQSLVVLLRPSKFYAPMDYQLPPGIYRVKLHYHGPSESERTFYQENSPNEPHARAWFGDAISNEVRFTVADIPGAKPPTLVWGEVQDGLQAAIEFRPIPGTLSSEGPLGTFPTQPEVSTIIHVKNVSDRTIKFVSETGRQGDELTVTDETGQTRRLEGAFFSGIPIVIRWTLKPGEIADLNLGNPSINQISRPGKYTIHYRLNFRALTRNNGEGESGFPKPDDWQQMLSPGDVTITIRSRPEKSAGSKS